jgi:hypothetical protein
MYPLVLDAFSEHNVNADQAAENATDYCRDNPADE